MRGLRGITPGCGREGRGGANLEGEGGELIRGGKIQVEQVAQCENSRAVDI